MGCKARHSRMTAATPINLVVQLTLLQKPSKHKGHKGARRKSLHLLTFVYVVSFVFKDLFAVDSQLQ
jgi:hypothetical protein